VVYASLALLSCSRVSVTIDNRKAGCPETVTAHRSMFGSFDASSPATTPQQRRRRDDDADGKMEPSAICESFRRILEGVTPGVPQMGSQMGSGAMPAPQRLLPPGHGMNVSQPIHTSQQTSSQQILGQSHAAIPSAEKDPYQSQLPINVVEQRIDLLSMFPSVYTFFLFSIFITPIWQICHIGHDSNVQYWAGPWCHTAAVLPMFFVAAHVVHLKKRVPHKPIVLISIFVPAIVLLVISNLVMTVAYDKADQLFSTDCDTFEGKRELQRAWNAGEAMYMKCLKDTTAKQNTNMTFAQAIQLYRITDCEEYPSAYRQHARQWDYLLYLEETHMCAGWCEKATRLWTYKDATDNCAVAASSVFIGKIQHISKQVLVYIIFTIVMSSVSLIAVGPRLRAMGFKW